MNGLPEDVQTKIWHHAMDDIRFANNTVKLVCRKAYEVFMNDAVSERTRRTCRESLCTKSLSRLCIHGRYCSVECAIDHLSGL